MLNKFLKKLGIKDTPKSDSTIVSDAITKKFTQQPDFPYLVSFPRTGSHWLRMLMEFYFEKPSLKLIFYPEYKEAQEFTCFHRHDVELEIERANVIYLYRNPVETIYSQLNYYKENTDDLERIKYWSLIYAKHLTKWLFEEDFTTKKTILTYENLKNDLANEFKKLSEHFGVPFDENRLNEVSSRVSKNRLKEKTKHDNQVINISSEYADNRKNFKIKHSDFIKKIILDYNPKLAIFEW